MSVRYSKSRRALDPVVNHLLQKSHPHLQEFLNAVKKNNLELIDKLIDNGEVDLKETIEDCDGAPFILALDQGSDEVFFHLIKKGVNPFYIKPFNNQMDNAHFVVRTGWYSYLSMDDVNPRLALKKIFLEECQPEPSSIVEIQQAALACIVCERDLYTFKKILSWNVKPEERFSIDKMSLIDYVKNISTWKPERFNVFLHELEELQKTPEKNSIFKKESNKLKMQS